MIFFFFLDYSIIIMGAGDLNHRCLYQKHLRSALGHDLEPPNIERPRNMGAIRFYLFIIVGIKDPEMGIGLWAMSKDIKSSKDKQILTGAYKLVVHGRSLVIRDRKCSLRRNISSAKQRRGPRSNPLSRTRQQAIMLARISIRQG